MQRQKCRRMGNARGYPAFSPYLRGRSTKGRADRLLTLVSTRSGRSGLAAEPFKAKHRLPRIVENFIEDGFHRLYGIGKYH